MIKFSFITFFILCSFNISAQDFRGFEFGKELPIKNGFQLISNDSFISVYIRKNEKMSIGDVKLQRIAYSSFQGKLIDVTIDTEIDKKTTSASVMANCQMLLDVLNAKYGEPSIEDVDDQGIKYIHTWKHEAVDIILISCTSKNEAAVLFYGDPRVILTIRDRELFEDASDAQKEAVNSSLRKIADEDM